MQLVQYVKYQTESTVTPRCKSSLWATNDTEIQSILIQTDRNRRGLAGG